MGECCVVISSELLDSLVFPVSLHSVILRSSTYNDIYDSGVHFSYTSLRSFCPSNRTPLLLACMRHVFCIL